MLESRDIHPQRVKKKICAENCNLFNIDYGSNRLCNLEIGLTAGRMIDQQGMLTPPWHMIPPLIYSEVCVRSFSHLYFL
jgi:hypothetical protein